MRGQRTNAWTFAALPPALRSEIEQAARARALGPDQFLKPPSPWTPRMAWHAVPAAHRENAEKLCAALAPALARQHELPGPQLMDLARIAYRQHFGNELAPDKLRYIMDRATKRDNGLGQFARPDLFLDESAFHSAASAPVEFNALHEPMAAHVAVVRNKSDPAHDDRKHLFLAAFKHLENLALQHPAKGEQRAAKNSLIEFLYRAIPGLYRPQIAGQSADTHKPLLALRTIFNQRYAAWIASGRKPESMEDKRAIKSGRKGYSCPPCEKTIRAFASRLRGPDCAGNVSLAIKMLCEKKNLCPVCREKLTARHISAAILERITPNAFEIAEHKGPRAIRAIAPTHHNDWSDTQPGDRFVIDDMTTNELTWDEVNGEIISGQAQLLYTADERSSMPLPFRLYFGAPNSITIKQAVRLVLSNMGLPRVGFYTERGVFNNRQLSGERNARHLLPIREFLASLETRLEFRALDASELKSVRAHRAEFFGASPPGQSPDEDTLETLRTTDLGLRDPAYGLRISQARNPQGKTVERDFYEFQKRASLLPGFAGFNQRNEKPKHLVDFDRRVAIGKEHPGNEYLHLSELRKNYELISAELAARPINGVRHRGRTPADMWNEAVNLHPLRKLPEEMEHLMATHRLPKIKVYPQGIKIALDRFEDAFYFNEHTGPFVGRHVAVRIDYDCPEFIHIEHPDTHAILKVDRALTKRRTATSEEIAKVSRARREHIKGARGESGNLNLAMKSYIIRDEYYTPRDMAQGRAIGDAKAAQKQAQGKTARQQKHLEKLAGTLGTSIPAQPRNRARTAEALELERQANEEICALENSNPSEGKIP